MQAAQFTGFGNPLEIVQLPTPGPPPGGVVIAVKAAGLCRSDWHAWQGHDPDIKSLPHVLGHEFSGEITALGSGVSSWQIGDRVTAPFACGCGCCSQCRSGNTQVCPDQYQPGVSGPGAFAEFVALPFAETNLVRLPDNVSFAAAASLGCRFATAYRALAHRDQANLQAGERIAIFGCGGVGLSAIMVARSLGAEVTAIDLRRPALDSARRLGADHLAHPDQLDGLEVDVAVDALGKTETCIAALMSLAPRGRHVQIGLMLAGDSAPPIPIGRIIARELHLIGSHGMGAAAYPELLARVAVGELTPQRLIGPSIALSELPSAISGMGHFATEPGVTVIERFSD
ncbi:MAG: alcohol dehydrogenase catalytic domain-containing protein [Verrucomicrobiales bacterium]